MSPEFKLDSLCPWHDLRSICFLRKDAKDKRENRVLGIDVFHPVVAAFIDVHYIFAKLQNSTYESLALLESTSCPSFHKLAWRQGSVRRREGLVVNY